MTQISSRSSQVSESPYGSETTQLPWAGKTKKGMWLLVPGCGERLGRSVCWELRTWRGLRQRRQKPEAKVKPSRCSLGCPNTCGCLLARSLKDKDNSRENVS